MTRARRKPNVPAGGSWTAEKQHDRGNAFSLPWGSSISLVLSQGVPHYTKHESHDIVIIILLGVGKNVNIICKIIQGILRYTEKEKRIALKLRTIAVSIPVRTVLREVCNVTQRRKYL